MKNLKWFIAFSIFNVTQAFAATQPVPATSAGSEPISAGMAQMMLLAAFAFIFYFMIIRPQSKRAKEHQQLVSGIQKGDEVLTTGGILGKVTKVTDNFLVVMIAEGVEVPVQKQAIASSMPKGTLKSI